MPLYKPGTENLYESGLDNLIQALLNRNAVVHIGNECIVQAHAAPDMGVRVRDGTVQGSSLRVAVAQTDLVVAANGGANARVDVVSVNFLTGVPQIIAGVAAATPKPPALPATDILLAYVSVPAAAVNIQAANISDRRLFVPLYEDPSGLGNQTNQNQILNSDFGRATTFGLAMPENFTDLNGATKIDGGAAGAVAANIFTQGAANNEYAWCAGAFVWRDLRASATFKATAIAGIYELRIRQDATHWVSVKQNNGNFTIDDHNGGTSIVFSTPNVLTINRWYWLEIEMQGVGIRARIYDTGGTVPGVTKAASTLMLPTATSSAGWTTTGFHVSITSDQAAAQWGGMAASPGGVYVETWLPDSHNITFGGTLGGQAIGYDDAAASGPNGIAWALRTYIPHAARSIQGLGTGIMRQSPSTVHTISAYAKVSGYGGAGQLIYVEVNGMSSIGWAANQATWDRKSASNPTLAALTQYDFGINIFFTATGTAYLMCMQLEQGAVVTPWRPSPADDAPLVWDLLLSRDVQTTAVGFADMEARDLAASLRFPWDASVTFDFTGDWENTTGTADNSAGLNFAGANVGSANGQIRNRVPGVSIMQSVTFQAKATVSAGRARVIGQWYVSAGTATLRGASFPAHLRVTAYRGK